MDAVVFVIYKGVGFRRVVRFSASLGCAGGPWPPAILSGPAVALACSVGRCSAVISFNRRAEGRGRAKVIQAGFTARAHAICWTKRNVSSSC